VDLAADVAQLADGDIFEPLSAAVEVLINLDGRLLHHGMRLLRTTKQDEIIAPGQPFMTVFGISGETNDPGLANAVGSQNRPLCSLVRRVKAAADDENRPTPNLVSIRLSGEI